MSMTAEIHKHELHDKVEAALNNIRPFLQSDGGNIELLEITEDLVAKVKLLGNCDTHTSCCTSDHAHSSFKACCI